MGSCESSFLKHPHLLTNLRRNNRREERRRSTTKENGVAVDYGGGWLFDDVPEFQEFSLADLRAATGDFSSDSVVSESGDNKSPNVVYRGYLHHGRDGDRRLIAVKRFTKSAWPDPEHFTAEALGVGKLRHKRLANLIGHCCDGDERLLVAEYMPNHSLAKHLFHWENQTIQWAMRLRVALYVAEALDYCGRNDRPLYHDLNAYRVLFDENGDPRLSCFGLLKNSPDGKCFSTNLTYTPPEYFKAGRINPESVIFSFGTLILDLLSGKHIPPSHALDTFQGKDILGLIDSHLEGNFSTEEAAMVFNLASKCLQNEPKDRPETKDLIAPLAVLQNKSDIPSHVMLRIRKIEATPKQHPLSPMDDACSRMDLTAVHQILEATQYKDGECTCELSFQQWTQQITDVLDVRKQGDSAFGNKDFKTAIENYSKFIEIGNMISPTVYARRSLSYLLCDQPDAALRDAMQAQCIYPDWSTAFYLQALALAKLKMCDDAKNMLREAGIVEEKRLKGGR